jgi:hypothetical protein
MSVSKVVIQLVDSGKEAFDMARRACFGSPRRGALVAEGKIK